MDPWFSSWYTYVNIDFHQTLNLPQQLSISDEQSSDRNTTSRFHRGSKLSQSCRGNVKEILLKFRAMSHFVSSATSSSSTNKVTSGTRDHHSAETIPFSFQLFEKEYYYHFSSQIKLRNKENKFRFLQDTEISFAENKKGNQGKLFQYFRFIFNLM